MAKLIVSIPMDFTRKMFGAMQLYLYEREFGYDLRLDVFALIFTIFILICFTKSSIWNMRFSNILTKYSIYLESRILD